VQPVQHLGQQRVLVGAQGVAVERQHELGGRAEPRERLERERAELEAVGDVVGRRPELVGVQRLEQLRAAPEDPDVRAEPLVRGADQRVAAEPRGVDRPVRRRVDRVDVDAGAGGVGGGDDAGQVGDRADGVARRGDRHPACPLAQRCLDRGGGQLERPGLGIGVADGRARALGRDPPRRDVRIVVQPRAHDFVAGAEGAGDGRGEAHRQRGHARPEDDAARVAAEQASDGLARRGDELVGRLGRAEDAAVVRVVAAAHEVGHRVDGGVDHLRPRRAVEPRPAVAQAREALADRRERGRRRHQ
jgi:hypothetical protein